MTTCPVSKYMHQIKEQSEQNAIIAPLVGGALVVLPSYLFEGLG